MNILSKVNISNDLPIMPWHITQSIDAFTAQRQYDIFLSGSLRVSGSTNLSGSTTFKNQVSMSNVSVNLTATSSWAQNCSQRDQVLVEWYDTVLNSGSARINWTFIPGVISLFNGSASLDLGTYNPIYIGKVYGTDYFITGITKINSSIVPNITSLDTVGSPGGGGVEIRETNLGTANSFASSDPVMFLILMKK